MSLNKQILPVSGLIFPQRSWAGTMILISLNQEPKKSQEWGKAVNSGYQLIRDTHDASRQASGVANLNTVQYPFAMIVEGVTSI